MTAPEGFDATTPRSVFRPTGTATLEHAIDLVDSAIQHACRIGVPELVVDLRDLHGMEIPNTFDRYALATRFATSAGAKVRVVMVARDELIDRDKIGMVIAANRGVAMEVFATEAAAHAWLDKMRG
jgi:hypothetical protein